MHNTRRTLLKSTAALGLLGLGAAPHFERKVEQNLRRAIPGAQTLDLEHGVAHGTGSALRSKVLPVPK